jgi:D-alanyl-D-alanine carboxypeptidase
MPNSPLGRMRHPTLAPNIIARPGSMSGISCLCGYSTGTNKPKIFVIMASSFSPPLKDIFGITDKIINERLR